MPVRSKAKESLKVAGGRRRASASDAARPAAGTRTAVGDEREQALVRAAFETLAERGFEGLRTREVAARAGVNIATLHYYFATKEALIAGVADSILRHFREEGAALAGETAAARLQDELRTTTQRMRRTPAIFIVLCELWLRAARDPEIGRACRSLNTAWRGYLTELIREGISDGALRPELDPAATADLVICTIHGVMSQLGVWKDLSPLERACSQLEQLLFKSERAVKTAPARRRLRNQS